MRGFVATILSAQRKPIVDSSACQSLNCAFLKHNPSDDHRPAPGCSQDGRKKRRAAVLCQSSLIGFPPAILPQILFVAPET
jgi:hypothetical protein